MTAAYTEIDSLDDVSDADLAAIQLCEDLDRREHYDTIQLCGEVGCLDPELWADGLCREHYEADPKDPREVTARTLQPGVPPARRNRASRGTVLLFAGGGSKKIPAFRKVKAFGCAVDGCPERRVASRGYCGPHYKRFLRNGDPGPADLLHQGAPPPEALERTVRGRPSCGPTTAHLFDPRDDEETRHERAGRHWAAAQLCASCPVLARCEQSLNNADEWAPDTRGGGGVWAGVEVLARGLREIHDPAHPRCSVCHVNKPLTEYPPSVAAGRSKTFRCRECSRDQNRRRKEADPTLRARIAERQREHLAQMRAESPQEYERYLARQRSYRSAR